MKKYKEIEKNEVWPHLQAGKVVYAVLFNSKRFGYPNIYDLTQKWSVEQINSLLNDENNEVIFYAKEGDIGKCLKKT